MRRRGVVLVAVLMLAMLAGRMLPLVILRRLADVQNSKPA